jgi:hypothetical protein
MAKIAEIGESEEEALPQASHFLLPPLYGVHPPFHLLKHRDQVMECTATSLPALSLVILDLETQTKIPGHKSDTGQSKTVPH